MFSMKISMNLVWIKQDLKIRITFICKIPVSGLLTKKVKPCSHTGSQERNMVAVLFVFPPILASR